MKRAISAFVILIVLGFVSFLLIFYGRGYRLDFRQRSLEPKGLLVINSQPNGAQVFVDGKLTTATNATLTLEPGWYTIRVEKEGYSSWQKKVIVQGEVVAKSDVILFPINPSLSPLTITGVISPSVSPDGNKIAFYVSKNTINGDAIDESGIYIMDLSDKPLGATRNTRQIAKDNTLLSYKDAVFTWDPTGKKLLAQIGKRYFLLDINILNNAPTEVTNILSQVNLEWDKDSLTLENERLSALKTELSNTLRSSVGKFLWSPDETKILYQASASATIPQVIKPPLIGTDPTEETRKIEKGAVYVYDIKEDRNYLIANGSQLGIINAKNNNLDKIPFIWFPTSSHLLWMQEGKIMVMDYDGLNKINLYAGPFVDDFMVPWPNGSKIIILTSLNPQPNANLNLYAVNIR